MIKYFCDLAKNCGQLSKPLNGSFIGSDTTYPNEVEFKCDEGFELQGSAIWKCEANGQWSGEDVKCKGTNLTNKRVQWSKFDILGVTWNSLVCCYCPGRVGERGVRPLKLHYGGYRPVSRHLSLGHLHSFEGL